MQIIQFCDWSLWLALVGALKLNWWEDLRGDPNKAIQGVQTTLLEEGDGLYDYRVLGKFVSFVSLWS